MIFKTRLPLSSTAASSLCADHMSLLVLFTEFSFCTLQASLNVSAEYPLIGYTFRSLAFYYAKVILLHFSIYVNLFSTHTRIDYNIVTAILFILFLSIELRSPIFSLSHFIFYSLFYRNLSYDLGFPLISKLSFISSFDHGDGKN